MTARNARPPENEPPPHPPRPPLPRGERGEKTSPGMALPGISPLPPRGGGVGGGGGSSTDPSTRETAVEKLPNRVILSNRKRLPTFLTPQGAGQADRSDRARRPGRPPSASTRHSP